MIKANRNIPQRFLSVALALLVSATAVGEHHTLAERIDTDERSDEDRARDAGRKPAAVLAFLGVEAGDSAIDIMAAGGWYTEVLAHAVGKDGRVAAQNPGFILAFRDGANDKALNERLAGDRLPNVMRIDREFDDLGDYAGQFDIALSALNFHDIYNRDGPEAAIAMLRHVRGTLKKGGVFGVIDHAGDAEADNAALHRIDKSLVIGAAEAAGFVVDGDSSLLASAEDDRTEMVFAPAVRGRTDRFVLRLVNP